MALAAKSLFLYGFQVGVLNSSLDFKSAALGPVKMATLRLGFYSLSGLGVEIVRAMNAADPANSYSVSINRNVSGGLQNRVTISTSGIFLSLLFLTGPRTASNCATLIGFNVLDYTGAITYTGASSAGTVLIPDYVGYGYTPPEFDKKVFGNVNVSASGQKESVVFAIQQFITVEFKYEPQAKVYSEWIGLSDWMILQKPFEFTPEISDPDTFYSVTLERSSKDGKGLGFMFKELLPKYPNVYTTSAINMRVTP